jgi:hypothetical protein
MPFRITSDTGRLQAIAGDHAMLNLTQCRSSWGKGNLYALFPDLLYCRFCFQQRLLDFLVLNPLYNIEQSLEQAAYFRGGVSFYQMNRSFADSR